MNDPSRPYNSQAISPRKLQGTKSSVEQLFDKMDVITFLRKRIITINSLDLDQQDSLNGFPAIKRSNVFQLARNRSKPQLKRLQFAYKSIQKPKRISHLNDLSCIVKSSAGTGIKYGNFLILRSQSRY